ncbi:SPFH domain-containing protein [Actinophytocola oryzae]|uniref:SPFH domain/Band 7 family protein n=1 Tax=Actinophytocola oryzae TaxID=502181 RepID=A0A4V3FUI5_9PSEU|nr:SPFH domain-containing protein [Actinophytocola oryzae]TDV55391.1 SPFH domain/Band 7 family protein [Actinophytocola oryzae]
MSRLRTILVSATAFAVALPAFIGWVGGYMKTDAGEVAVVRNGGLFDDNQIRQIIDPGSSLTWTGFWSTSHRYPAQQRFYTIAASGDTHNGERAGVDVVTVPSSDGVNMGMEGTFYFTLNLDHRTLRDFDSKFGTRTFRGADGEFRHAWDGDIGWSSFLDQIVRPVIDNAIREQVNSTRCVELVSSCALVQNQVGAASPPPVSGQPNNANIAKVQNAITGSVRDDLRRNLGADFLVDIKFILAKVTLPQPVQQAVDNAQAAYAQVSESQARATQAQAQAQANRERQRGYDVCPACAQIDIMKAIPTNVTVYAPGAGAAVPLTPTR